MGGKRNFCLLCLISSLLCVFAGTEESEAVPDVYEAKLQRDINLFIIL